MKKNSSSKKMWIDKLNFNNGFSGALPPPKKKKNLSERVRRNEVRPKGRYASLTSFVFYSSLGENKTSLSPT